MKTKQKYYSDFPAFDYYWRENGQCLHPQAILPVEALSFARKVALSVYEDLDTIHQDVLKDRIEEVEAERDKAESKLEDAQGLLQQIGDLIERGDGSDAEILKQIYDLIPAKGE